MTSFSQSDVSISERKLWFGFAGSVCAWIGLGIADILVAWQACLGDEQFGGSRYRPGFETLFILITASLLVLAIVAGTTSYRNWKALTDDRKLRTAEGRERFEYMALAGVFVSFTLGMGIVWLAIPLGMIALCVRAR